MELRPVDIEMASLLLGNRWAALALATDERPAVSMVAYAVGADGGILMFLSSLAAHTGILRERGFAAMVVGAPDLGAGDPQELPRLSLEGPVEQISRESTAFSEEWPRYAARFPAAVARLALADFSLFRMTPLRGRCVGGFARALDAQPERLSAAVRSLQSG